LPSLTLRPPAVPLPFRQGFGPDGLGIVTVSGVPGFPALRERLLPLAAALAGLPDAVKAGLEDAASNYNVGWSHGKEALEGGRLDLLKGSFYANPTRCASDCVEQRGGGGGRWGGLRWPRRAGSSRGAGTLRTPYSQARGPAAAGARGAVSAQARLASPHALIANAAPSPPLNHTSQGHV
jgi:hypothetical protein